MRAKRPPQPQVSEANEKKQHNDRQIKSKK
jgi:hypothetical protein